MSLTLAKRHNASLSSFFWVICGLFCDNIQTNLGRTFALRSKICVRGALRKARYFEMVATEQSFEISRCFFFLGVSCYAFSTFFTDVSVILRQCSL